METSQCQSVFTPYGFNIVCQPRPNYQRYQMYENFSSVPYAPFPEKPQNGWVYLLPVRADFR